MTAPEQLDDERRRLSFHEGGHVVALVALALPIYEASIDVVGDDFHGRTLGGWVDSTRASPFQIGAAGVVLAAGAAGEEMAGYMPTSQGSALDREMSDRLAEQVAARFGVAAERWVWERMQYARLLLTWARDGLEAVASRLVSGATVGGAELATIVRAALPSSKSGELLRVLAAQ